MRRLSLPWLAFGFLLASALWVAVFIVGDVMGWLTWAEWLAGR